MSATARQRAWNGWTDNELRELLDTLHDDYHYPAVDPDFHHVADAANDAIRPIIRHLRHVTQTAARNHHRKGTGDGTAIVRAAPGVATIPRTRGHGRPARHPSTLTGAK